MIPKISIESDFDVQGHRGCRGLLPENTLEAFLKALELGVTTLEMDLVVSKDHEVVVSHEPFFSHEISTAPDGTLIKEENEKEHNIYKMDYDQIRKYDVGKRIHPRFPEQKKLAACKPLFESVIDMAETVSKGDILYNVEIKSTIEGDFIFHPDIPTFVNLVVEILKKKVIESRSIIQSFDIRALQYLHSHHPSITTSFLVENNLSPEKNLKKLGFVPDIYSPEFILVDDHLIKFARSHSMRVIPWTANSPLDIETLIQLGVDGIITDYPNLFQLS